MGDGARIEFIDMPDWQDTAWYPEFNLVAVARRIQHDPAACEAALDRLQAEWRAELPPFAPEPLRPAA